MTVDEWIEQTDVSTLAFSQGLEGAAVRQRAADANSSWKFLSEYGRKVWLCQFCNPRKA